MKLKILYEDNHIIAVEKEAGMLTQQDASRVPSLMDHIKDYIKRTYNKPGNVFLGMVHRLDKPVSGVIVFAKTSKAASRFHEAFLSKSIVKIYLAIVETSTSINTDDWITLEQDLLRKKGISEIRREKHTYSKEVALRYRKIFSDGKKSLLMVQLLTGKKHQIRAQLSSVGMPIIGDAKYGSHTDMGGKKICLHAFFLAFDHPISKEKIMLNADMPEHMSRIIPQAGQLKDDIMKIAQSCADAQA